MFAIIDAALSRSRTIITLLILLLIAGAIMYQVVPKESNPDVTIPIIYTSVSHEASAPRTQSVC